MSELTLNQKVTNFANSKLGQQVGAGECWDLANSALKDAGAGTSSDFGPMGDDADYVWGTPIPDLKDVIPGDILQYRDFVMKTITKTDVSFSDNTGWVDDTSVEISHPHHTSIVFINSGDANLTVLEQNDQGKHEKVKKNLIRWKDAATTKNTTKQMMEREDKNKKKIKEMATVTVTVDTAVTGTIKAYRPKLK